MPLKQVPDGQYPSPVPSLDEPWPPPLNHTCCTFFYCSFLEVENSLGLFFSQVGSLARWGLSLRAPFPLFYHWSDLSLISLSLSAQDLSETLCFLVFFFFSNYSFYFFLCHLLFFATYDYYHCATESVVGCLEISSAAEEISPWLLNGVSHSFLEKRSHFCPNITSMVSSTLASTVPLWNLLCWPPHNPHSSQHYCLPSPNSDGPLNSA